MQKNRFFENVITEDPLNPFLSYEVLFLKKTGRYIISAVTVIGYC